MQKAFTMAEILLSLTIIGVVAAITLPSLTGNINERTWNTQRKTLYARMSQAIALMPSLNGYGTYIPNEYDSEGNMTVPGIDTAAETFVTEGLSKVLKINNVCDSEHLNDCGITSKILDRNGNVAFESFPKTMYEYNDRFSNSAASTIAPNVVGFETANGESLALFYNPQCTVKNDAETYSQRAMCLNFIFDLNGNKGPNQLEKDIGIMTAFYSVDPVLVLPIWAGTYPDTPYSKSVQMCKKKYGDGVKIPNKEEAAAIYFNKILMAITHNGAYLTSNTVSNAPEKVYTISFGNSGMWVINLKTANVTLMCIKNLK